MKRMLALWLTVTFLLGLCACEGKPVKKPAKSPDTILREETFQAIEEPSVTQPSGLELSVDNWMTVEGVLSVKVVHLYTAEDVKPPIVSGVYTHYQAEQGYWYLVAVMDVKHLGTVEKMANELLVPVADVDGQSYTPFVLVETDGGTKLDRGSATTVVPLQTVRLFLLYTLPLTADAGEISLSATVDTVKCIGNFTLEDMQARIPTLAVGDVVTKEEAIRVTLETVEFANSLYPSNPTGYNHYYTAEEGMCFLVVKLRAENLKDQELGYDEVAGLTCTYQQKYQYQFSVVFEEDNGEDLCGYPNLYAMASREEGVLYYLAQVPKEVSEGPVEIALYLAGQYYRITMEGTI